MAKPLMEAKGLDELIKRMQAYPLELHKSMSQTMAASLLVFWESVPGYPPPPENSAYDRTGTLGKSLGSDIGGGMGGGEPSIFTIRPLGSTGYEGKFGTNLSYAERVIGEGTQAPAFEGRWWIIKTVAERAAQKVNKLWQMLAEKMAAFLEGKQ